MSLSNLRSTIYDLRSKFNDRRHPLPKLKIILPIFLLILSVLSVLFSSRLLAQQSDYQEWSDGVKNPSLQNWLNVGMESNIFSISKILVGEIPTPVLNGQPTSWIPGGVMGTTAQLTAATFSPPASGVQYLAELKDGFLGKPAYAQGVGFSSLRTLLPVWRSFRNVTYILSSLIFIIMGLMIMFRIKISPQAVITIQTAIPQLITTLILITFSYAIAGLIIDFSYFFQASFVTLVAGNIVNNPITKIISVILTLTGSSLKSIIPSVGNLTVPDWGTFSSLLIFPVITTAMMGTILGITIGSMLGLPGIILGSAVGGIGSIVIGIVVMIAMLFWLISFCFGLFKCYATVIFKIIIAPLEIAMGAFPGSKLGFNSWITDLIANVMVFPITIVFLVMSNKIIFEMIIGSGTVTLQNLINLVTLHPDKITSMWAPSILAPANNITGALPYTALLSVCAIGIATLMLLSKLPELIPQAIFMLKPSAWETAIGQGLDMSRNPIWQSTKTAGTSIGITTATSWLHSRGDKIEQDALIDTERDADEREAALAKARFIKGAARNIQGGAYQAKLTVSPEPGKFNKT